MARTALDLITASLKRLNAIGGIETPSADLAADALDRLNDLLETWRTEHLTIWAITASPLIPIGGTAADNPYLLGPGGVVTTRPEWIEGVNVRLFGSPSYEVPLTRWDNEDWRAERNKTQTAPQPTHYHYEPSWPTAKLYVYPTVIGGSVTSGLVLYLPTPITAVPTLTTIIDLPSGYYRALRDNLAIELAPELGAQVHEALQFSARDALSQLKRANHRPRTLQMPPELPAGACHGVYDWRLGK